MQKFQIIPYAKSYFNSWNKFVQDSINGTLFHRLDFLSYHGRDFLESTHNLMWMKGKSIYAAIPMAVFDGKGRKIALSPFGASYGGFVVKTLLGYDKATLLVEQFIEYLQSLNVDECRITFPIRAAYKDYSETLFLVLYEKGFVLTNTDISSVVELNDELKYIVQSSARRNVKKAEREGIVFRHNAPLKDFRIPFEKTFQKHKAKPTHNLDELKWLNENFPDSVYFDVAYHERQPVSGICHFVQNSRLDSSFYLCNNPEYEKLQGLPFLVYYSLVQSRKKRFRYFDFGTSSVNTQGRSYIFKFKEKFGAIGQFRNTFVWKNSAE
ncbi:MAG: hypothetical protein ACLFUW_01010 [Bacteroidales bacterium]